MADITGSSVQNYKMAETKMQWPIKSLVATCPPPFPLKATISKTASMAGLSVENAARYVHVEFYKDIRVTHNCTTTMEAQLFL